MSLQDLFEASVAKMKLVFNDYQENAMATDEGRNMNNRNAG